MRRLWMLSLVVGTLALLAVPVASAQEATPAADVPSDRTAFLAAPAECVIGVRLPADVNALATPLAGGAAAASPVAADDAIPFGAPDGEPADAETAAAVTAIFRQTWACQNGGLWPRFFALLTDDEVRRNFSPEDVTNLLAQPPVELPEEEQTAVYAVLDVEILPDGRAGAYVVVDTVGDPLPVEINYMIALETEAGWRVDGFICFSDTGGLC